MTKDCNVDQLDESYSLSKEKYVEDSIGRLAIGDTAGKESLESPSKIESVSEKHAIGRKQKAQKEPFSTSTIQKWFLESPAKSAIEPTVTAAGEVIDRVAEASPPPKQLFETRSATDTDKGFKSIYAPLTQFKCRYEPHSYFRGVSVRETSVQTLLTKLNGIGADETPLATVQQYLKILTSEGSDVASFAFEHLRGIMASKASKKCTSQLTVKLKSTGRDDHEHTAMCQHPWFSCEITAISICAIAAPANSFKPFAKGISLAGVVHRLENLRGPSGSRPSASLRKPFERAKRAARGGRKSTSIIRVGLMDYGYDHLQSVKDELNVDPKRFFSFNHHFVLGVGPEGMVMWHSFRNYGPRLPDHIALGGARVRTWKEADEFVTMFDQFAASHDGDRFTSQKNDQYRRLFGLDLLALIADPATPPTSMAPHFEAWVQIEVIEDVKSEDVTKFEWIVDEDAPENKNWRPSTLIIAWVNKVATPVS